MTIIQFIKKEILFCASGIEVRFLLVNKSVIRTQLKKLQDESVGHTPVNAAPSVGYCAGATMRKAVSFAGA